MLKVIEKATFVLGMSRVVLEPGTYDVISCKQDLGNTVVEFRQEGTLMLESGKIEWVEKG